LIFDKLEDQLLEKCKIEALTGARVMSEILELMVKTDILDKGEIFDSNYVYIKGTDPKKYNTKYDKAFDKYIQSIQEEFLSDEDVDYAILIDQNGYVPTHNLKYSKPISGDVKIDLKYSRSKRNFASNTAIKQALKYRGYKTVKVLYKRDTGEQMWNIGASVNVMGKHWGSFIVGVSLSRTDIIKNQMLILIITTIVVIISLTMLAMLAVTPRKYFFSKGEADIPKY